MPAVWAIADLHLSFGTPGKEMDPFGSKWHAHGDKIKEAWLRTIAPEDLVLIAGDISWAMRPEQALVDLLWIDALPGKKLMVRGNHDYWWSSLKKARSICPPSIHLVQNDSIIWGDYCVGGTRLWDSGEYNFKDYIEYQENPLAKQKDEASQPSLEESEKIFERELLRLEMSLKTFPAHHKGKRICMTHYPPIGVDLASSRASSLFDKYNVDLVVFGHIHNTKQGVDIFGVKNNTRYVLTAADYLDFMPVRVF